ncbi:hypothetical protein TUN205_11832, partial [Pyrenophora tritici-repentis]
MSPFSGNKDKLVRSKVDGDNRSAQGCVIPQSRRRSEPSNLCLEVETQENKDSGGAARISADIHFVESARCLTLARKSNSGENGFRLAGTSSSPVFDPKVAKQGNLSDVAELIGKNSDNSLFRRTVDVECHQAANNLAPFARESALIENMISEYASLFNGDFDSGLVDM